MHLKLITLVPRGSSKTNTTVLVLWFLTVALMCTKCIQCLSIDQIRDQVSTKEIIGNTSTSQEEKTTYAPNSTLSSGRNSRQLWSFVKNVIKTSLDQKQQQNDSPVSGGLGALASLIGSGIASGISSDSASVATSHLQNSAYPPPPAAPSPANHFGSPNDYMHYLLLNSQSNQHTSLPHFQQQQQQTTSQLIEKYQQEMTSPVTNTASVSSTGNQILSKLALGSILDDFDLDKVSNFLSFGNFESMVEKVNKFDKLRCIPRMLCQMVAKRAEDERKEEERRATTTTTTKRPTKAKKKSDEKDDVSGEKERLRSETPKDKKNNDEDKGKLNQKQDDEEDDDNENEDDDDDDENDDDDDEDEEESDEKEYVVIKQGSVRDKTEASGEKEKSTPQGRTGRVFKINGADTALEQFVKFLELMQLKDWSLYPYLQGAYQGHQVTRTDECAYKYPTCPFSDDQLVYYFNNYNGGFFQSI